MLKRITSIKQLKEDCKGESQSYYISLNGGLKSSKEIRYHEIDAIFCIYNNIDDTHQDINEIELEETNIPEAIRRRRFFKENDNDR